MLAPGKRFRLLPFLLSTALLCGYCYAEDVKVTPEQKESELKSLRSQIKHVQSSIRTASNELEGLLKQLQKFELAAASTSKTINELKQQISEKKQLLQKLEAEQQQHEKSLNREQNLLARQIRAAYKTGRNDYIKLLLNQEDPALVGRIVAYHHYFNRARAERIDTVNTGLKKIVQHQQQIALETQKLEKLRSGELAKLEEYKAYRSSRSTTLKRLQKYVQSQDKQLQILQRNEQELALLVEKLRQQKSVVELFENMPPFDSLKGSLSWPVKGRISHRFGQYKKGNKLKWQGVTIRAKAGENVRAVSTGKVIFADWFRNMGLLLIIDHGDGYMSLYGHNEALDKKSGDWVKTGDVVAKVGDTGGQQDTAVYFEIRKSGTPLNPKLWCKK